MIFNKKGMTLVEIMIVLAILGGLIAVMLPVTIGYLDKAKVKEAKILISNVVQKLNLYYADCGQYPSNDVGLEALVSDPGEDECNNWGPEPYLKKIPKDPWNRDLIYEENGGGFVILTRGKDGKEGGDGYDADISSEDL